MSLLAARHVVTGAVDSGRPVVGEATLAIEGERIVGVTAGIDPAAELVEGWIVPGFIDVHNHGAAGYSYGDPDPEHVLAAVARHRSHGTTSMFASTVTESLESLESQVSSLAAFVESGEIDGIHLEGPFLSPSHKGAHDVDLLTAPTAEAIDGLLSAGRGTVRMVTLAPELPGGIEAVRRFAEAGVSVAFGHSAADQVQVRAAIDAGVTTVTHLFNAMTGIHHRKPGPIPWLLTDDRVSVELICDGTHLHADTIRLAIETAGPERVLLVTDAMSATGQPDGRYLLGSLQVDVIDGVARIVVDSDEPGPIAGSTLTMDRAVEFVVQQVGCSIPEAALMASSTPARWHGLDEVGMLAPGRLANLCVLDDDASLRRVLRRGAWLEGEGS